MYLFFAANTHKLFNIHTNLSKIISYNIIFHYITIPYNLQIHKP